MKRQLNLKPGLVRKLLFVVLTFLVLSVVLAAVSLFPVTTGVRDSSVLIDDSFRLSPGEVRREGIGSFYGGENVTVSVKGLTAFPKNFSIVTYNGPHFANYTEKDIAFTFPVGADYYEAVFYSNSSAAGQIDFQVTVEAPVFLFPFSWLTTPAKIMFVISLCSAMVILLKSLFAGSSKLSVSNSHFPVLSKMNRHRLILLLVFSFIFWFSLLSVNTNSLATFEDWYTDHARHSYTSMLFTKVGFSVFDKPLGVLASADGSFFKYITWPEMPHLYPLGSIVLFLPFGIALQNGLDPALVYKTEITLFLLIAHVGLYFFLKYFLKKDVDLGLKLAGVYVIYVPLVVFAANGMFDSAAFLFTLLGFIMFMEQRYDYFLVLVASSIIFKYQAGVFLLPLIVVAVLKLYEKYRFKGILRNKAVIASAVLIVVSGFTAYLSAPFLLQTRPHLVMNGINAFASNAQIPWLLQSFGVLLTLSITVIYSVYMFGKNNLLSLSALFLLFPSFTLPYFQNWYLPFIFIYVLIPQNKKELEVTMLWLIFIIVVLSFGGIAYNPLNIFNNLINVLKNFAGSFSPAG